MRLWNIDEFKPDNRGKEIIEALKNLLLPKTFRLLDVACGYGDTLMEIKRAFPEAEVLGIDIASYPQWDNGPFKEIALQDFRATDQEFEVVMMLNSYRNWTGPEKDKFDDWVHRNADYFITSTIGSEPKWASKQIGSDTHGIPLKLFTNYDKSF